MGNSLFAKFKENLGPLASKSYFSHHYFSYPMLTGDIGPYMEFNGKRVLNWSLNNYLGLSDHPEVRKADSEAIDKYGLAYPMGSRIMSGDSVHHEEFEKQLAEFSGYESAFLMNFGYQGIMSTIEALVDHRDVIVYDSDCHACLIDGVRLHKAKGGVYYQYAHNNMESFEKNLIRANNYASQTGGGVLVITEGVFGMTGQVGKIDEIAKFKEKYEFKLLVDDAHGFGVIGDTGRGVGEYLGCQDKIDIYFATFTKSMSAMGCFVATEKYIINYLKYAVRSQIYAKSLPMGYVLGGLKRLQLIRENPQFREKLWHVANRLQKGLKEKGFDLGSSNSHVTPVHLNQHFNLNEVCNLTMDLRENMGVFCSVVVYPFVPKNVIILRLIPTSTHSDEDIDYTISCFEKIREKLSNHEYNFEIPIKSELFS